MGIEWSHDQMTSHDPELKGQGYDEPYLD